MRQEHSLCGVRVSLLEPVKQEVAVPETLALLAQLLDVGNGLRVLHHFNEARLFSCGKAAVGEHPAGVKLYPCDKELSICILVDMDKFIDLVL